MFDAPYQAVPADGSLPPDGPFRSVPLVSLAESRLDARLSTFRLRARLANLDGQIPYAKKIDNVIEEVCGGRWRIGKRTARALALIFANASPAGVLEFGSGASTVIFAALAKYAERGTRVVSIDENPEYAAKTRALLDDFGLRSFATVVTAPVTQRMLGDWHGYAYQPDALFMATLFETAPADLVFIDGPASWMTSRADCRFGTLLTARDWLADRAIFIADDVFRANEEAILRRWDQLPGVRVHGVVPVGRGLGVGEIRIGKEGSDRGLPLGEAGDAGTPTGMLS